MRWIALALLGLFLVLAQKRVWCLRWLWCYGRGREMPAPIGWLPRRSGAGFEAHVRERDRESGSHRSNVRERRDEGRTRENGAAVF